MKKIGLVTLYGNFNYGNRLQNYAVQQVFLKNGIKCETIVVEKSRSKSVAKKIVQTLKALLGNKTSIRKNKFDRFNYNYITTRKIYRKNGLIPRKIDSDYSFFCVGSDQVWNPEIRKKERWNLFLQFTDTTKKMCLSPSIGVNEIPDQYREEFALYLKDFKRLSCRESLGAQDISNLTEKHCDYIIDPTLAISKDEWVDFATALNVKRKYIVVFFLGDMSAVDYEKISCYAQKLDYEIINLSDKTCLYYAIDPKEFVGLIHDAQLVFTDSFHAAAFSINLNTPFYVLDRHQKEEVSNRVSSRIHSLVSLFKLESRYCPEGIKDITEVCDFSNVNDILVRERARFSDYVQSCLGDFREVWDED